jgi:rod shape-determining protein MreC
MKLFFKSRTEFIFLIAALFIHLLLLSTRLSQVKETPLLRGLALEVVAPLLKGAVGSISSISHVWKGYIDLRNTHQENQQLKMQVADFQRTLLAYEERIKELERLKTLKELQDSLMIPSVRARVIGGAAMQWYSSRILDQGSDAGVTKDCAAINAEGVVGRIVQVSRKASVLQLITDFDSGVGVLLENSRAQGVLKGEGNRQAYVEYVGSNEKVVAGEKVLTSGLDQIYPKGLLVGYVLGAAPSKLVFQKIEVNISANVFKLEEVLILKNKKESQS